MARQAQRTGRRDARPSSKTRAQLVNSVTARLEGSSLQSEVNAQELSLRPGDHVIVETSRGPCLAQITGHVQRRTLPGHPPHVLRRATDHDLRQLEENRQVEHDAYLFALGRVRERDLPMKLVRTQLMHDSSKMVFFFNAEGRVDFRGLVRDLASRFRTRIEMHQIGVRDGARMLGGIGPCGRELCCSTFLEHFAPVSIRMAKEQGLTLNPKKVSGMCGRLMCCLVYEQQLYKKNRRRLPRPRQQVMTTQGEGVILSVDVINERLLVELEDTNRKTFALHEVVLQGSKSADVTTVSTAKLAGIGNAGGDDSRFEACASSRCDTSMLVWGLCTKEKQNSLP